MIKYGDKQLNESLLKIFNEVLSNEIECPMEWKIGDIISIYKGKGNKNKMECQRGITLTSCILKTLEKMINNRIDPIIKRNSTPMQGGGKRNESVEEYIFVLQTIIDLNEKETTFNNNRRSKSI